MTPRNFWSCTPRKLNALLKLHAELNDPGDSNKTKTKGAKTGGVPGRPTHYIDQLPFI